MSYLPLYFVLLTSSFIVYANDEFSELDEEIYRFESEKAEVAGEQDEFKKYLQTHQSDYQMWQAQYLKEFDLFQQQVIKQWGRVELAQSQHSIEYSTDKKSKTVIDFERQQLEVALIVDKNMSQVEAEKVLKKQILTLLSDKASTIAKLYGQEKIATDGQLLFTDVEFTELNKQQSKDVIVKQTQALAQEIDKQSDRALLADSALTEKEARLLATQEKSELLQTSQVRLNNSDKNYEKAKSEAPNNTKIISYTVKLPKNSLKHRASKYVAFAERESQVNDIPAPLIMAIMHSESAFNPKAKSAVPAYGLMQIVPQTAGHDVNKLLRNIDEPMQVADLYVPQINVETGSAYLNILDKRYLKAIKNDQSRLYCTIAAYNTGAGNVARVFNKDGARNINKAAKIINKLSAEEVYQQLLAKLPYDETKHYLQRVNSRIALYQH